MVESSVRCWIAERPLLRRLLSRSLARPRPLRPRLESRLKRRSGGGDGGGERRGKRDSCSHARSVALSLPSFQVHPAPMRERDRGRTKRVCGAHGYQVVLQTEKDGNNFDIKSMTVSLTHMGKITSPTWQPWTRTQRYIRSFSASEAAAALSPAKGGRAADRPRPAEVTGAAGAWVAVLSLERHFLCLVQGQNHL